MKAFSESALWHGFKNGSREAFTLLYRDYVQSMYNYGKFLTQDEDLIEDCIQDLFIDLWRNRQNLGDVRSVKYYLLKAIKRKITGRLVLNRKYVSDELNKEADYAYNTLPYELDLIADQFLEGQKQHLRNALDKLTPRQREAISLRFYDGLSYQEIASIMSLNVNSVYNLISRAVDALRKNLTKAFLLAIAFFLA